MSTVSRRNVLSLGAALGLTGALAPSAAWSWAPSGSIAGTGTGIDPQWVWDDEIDRIMAGVIDAGQVPAVNAAYGSWVNNDDAVPAGLPPELRAYLQRTTRLPDWADVGKLRRAADYNRRKDTYFFVIYGIGGGIMSTVIPREAKSVYWSKGGADMQDRAAKTFTFGYDMAELGGYEPRGQFLVTANKTRTVHAAVRHLLPQSPHWRAVADERIPISNHDILVTFHSTGTFAHKKLNEWGAAGSAADQEAFLHSWQVALHLLGVHDEYIPATWNDAHAQSAQILTPILNPTLEGRELAEVLLGLTAQVDLGVTRGFLNEFVRYQLGDQVGDWLNLRRDYAAKALIRTAWPAYVGFREGTVRIMPVTYYMFDQFIRALAMAFLNKGQDGKTTPITVPDTNRP
jgi:endo-cleaving rubber dioxygenase